MILVLTLLFLSTLLLLSGLVGQVVGRVGSSPAGFMFGILFLLLFALAPLLVLSTMGDAISIQGFPLDDTAWYLVYAMTIASCSLAYALCYGSHRPSSGDLTGESVRTGQGPGPLMGRDAFVHLCAAAVVPLGLALVIKGTGMSIAQLIVASRFQWFAQGTVNSGVLNLGFYLLGFSAVFAFYDVKYRVPRRALSSVVYGVLLATIVLTGGRKWLLFLASGVVAGYFDGLGGRFHLNRRMLFILFSVGFLVFFLQFGRRVSWQEEPDLAEVGREFVAEVPVLVAEGDATYFYRASLDAIRLNMDQGVVYPLAVVRRVLLMPIPDNLTFGLKPEGVPFLFSEELDRGNKSRRGNQPPGLVGLFVLSFGWKLGLVAMPIILMLVLGLADRVIVSRRGPWRDAFFASFGVAAILALRGSTGGLYFLVFNLLVVSILVAVFHLLEAVGVSARAYAAQKIPWGVQRARKDELP